MALTPQAVAALSNLGLVKRAQKELEQGKGPALEVLEDGTVVGRFADGAVARLEPGRGLRDSPCTCASSGVCRHRVGVALAYPAFARAGAGAKSEGGGAWSPGEVSDEALAATVPTRLLERAAAYRERGFVARVHRGAGGEDIPAVALATCSVRFLAPRDLSYARCDCATALRCEHVPLAVWAFREADRREPGAGEVVVEVSSARGGDPGHGAALEAAVEVASFVLAEGVEPLSGTPAHGARFAVARTAMERGRMAWLLGALDELEQVLIDHGARSARYAPERAASVLAEVFARTAAARAPADATAVPARAILGGDEAPETRLDHLRAISLGARVLAAGRDRAVELFLVDPAAAGLLVLRRDYTYADDEIPEDGPALARRSAFGGASVEMAARGQVVTTGATRWPNRLVGFSSRGLARTSVTPHAGDWRDLPAEIRVDDVEALGVRMRERAPRFLRPRLLAEDVHVFGVSEVLDVAYVPGAQRLSARVADLAGGELQVELAHRSVTPGALDALAELLQGQRGRICALSGEARWTGHGVVVQPIAVARVDDVPVVLDLEPAPTKTGKMRVNELRPPEDPVAAVVSRASGLLQEAAHRGLRHLDVGWKERMDQAATALDAHGLTRLGTAARAAAAGAQGLLATGQPAAEAAAVRAWAAAAVRCTVAIEQAAG